MFLSHVSCRAILPLLLLAAGPVWGEDIDAKVYFPLEPGNQWTYRQNGDTEVAL